MLVDFFTSDSGREHMFGVDTARFRMDCPYNLVEDYEGGSAFYQPFPSLLRRWHSLN
jgi:hypothetical protein